MRTDHLGTARLIHKKNNKPSTTASEFKDETWTRAMAELKDAQDGLLGNNVPGQE